MKDKSEIFLDLRKLTKEEIMSIPEILGSMGRTIDVNYLNRIISGNNPFRCFYLHEKSWSITTVPFTKKMTENTFTEFRALFRDYEGEMVNILKRMLSAFEYDNASEFDFQIFFDSKQLIKEVEQKRNNK